MKLLILAGIVSVLSGCAKNVFQLPPDYPVIDSISPAEGRIGTQLHVYGSGFSTAADQDSFTINGVAVQVQAATSTVMLATVTSNTGTGHVALSVDGKQAQGPIFTFNTNAVSLNSLTPAAGWTDTVVTLRGVGFGSFLDSVIVSFNGVPATIQKFSDTLIVVLTPVVPGVNGTVVTVTVKVGTQLSNGLPFSYGQGATSSPSIRAIVAAGRQANQFAIGDTVFIYGKSFGSQQPGYSLQVWSRDSTTHFTPDPAVLSWVDTLITAVIPNWSGNLTNGSPLTVYVREGATYAADTASWIVAASVGQFVAAFTINRKSYASAGAGNYILFGGGSTPGGVKVDTVDVFNIVTQTWSTSKLSEARDQLAGAAAGSKIVFAGGSSSGLSTTVDIFDANTGGWATSTLPHSGFLTTAAGAGNKIVIIASDEANGGIGSVADIYDVNSGTWTSGGHLAETGGPVVVAAGAGGKVVFAGFHDPATGLPLATVDIFDINAGTWSQAQLSDARSSLAAAAAGNKILIAGGYSYGKGAQSNVVDIYDVSTGVWTTAQLSVARSSLAGAGAGSKVVFAGGTSGGDASTVDIYDVNTGQWTTANLSKARYFLAPAGAGAGNTVIFGPGASSYGLANVADIFAF